jgi:hypothetical protein
VKVRGLLIPGTGATALRDSLGHNLGNPARPDTAFGLAALAARSPQEAVDTLAMEHREGQWAPLRSSIQDGRSILPNHVFTALYTRLPKDWAHFMYDWRADLRYNAERLVHWLTTRTRDGERWHMAAHSQGALVAVLAAKMMDDEETFARYVARLRLVAPPLAGTLISATWMIDGLSPVEEGSVFERVLDGARDAMPDGWADIERSEEPSNLQEAVRTWPALYQMLPAWDAIGEDDGDDGNLMRPGAWRGHDAIDPALLVRARETREWLADPLSHLRGVDTELLMTSDKKTPLSLRPGDERLSSTVARSGPGDTLIPYDATLDWYGGSLNEAVRRIDDVEPAHAKLLNASKIWERAKE